MLVWGQGVYALLLLCDVLCLLQEPVKLLNAMIEKAVIECVALHSVDFPSHAAPQILHHQRCRYNGSAGIRCDV